MADESRNPADNASMNALRRELQGVKGELTAMRREAEAEGKATRQQVARQASEAKAEAKRRPSTRGPVPETPAEARGVADQTERQARAQRKLADDTERQLKARQQLGRAFARGRLPVGTRLGAGGAGGGEPPLPPAPPTPPGGGDEPPKFRNLYALLDSHRNQKVRQAAANITQGLDEKDLETLSRGAREAAEGNRILEQRLQGSTRQLRMNGDELRRHGALTTEFIAAAARGQTTIRELGFQAGATIAKFGGWTAAASAVYGVAAAMAQLGQGAVSSLEGVNQLQRILPQVNTEEAQQKFRDLADEFNMPIEQVASTQYEMSRIFRDQGDAATAAQVALRAMSVAELDAGESTRYLSAIVKGFRLNADELPLVLDQINEATNKFGGNTGQLVEGVSKAGGQFRAAGGDVQYLISLIEAGTSLTGRTGSEIGTAIQRSAEILQRPERRAKIIDLLGIDPQDHSIEEVYERAFEKARGATGADVTAIATALSTPQLATRITPILQNEPLFRDINKAIDPQQAQGSAVRENERRLKGFREQVKQLGVDLQRLGSALAQSGALEPIGAMVKGLHQVLDLGVKFLELVNEIPKPLRTGAFFIAEIAAAMALMRRFNVGEIVPQRFSVTRQALSRNPEALARAQTFQGLGDEREFLRGALNQAGVEAARADYAALRGAQERNRVFADSNATDEQRLAAQHRYERLADDAVQVERERDELQSRYNRNEEQRNNVRRRLRAGENIGTAGPAEGVFMRNETLERQSGARPVVLGPRGEIISGAADDLTAQARGADRLADENRKLDEATKQSTRAAQRAGITGRVVGGSMLAGGGVIRGAGRGIASFGRGIAGFGRELAGSIGALDVAVVGLATAFAVFESIQADIDKADALSADLNAPKSGVQGMQDAVDKARKADQSIKTRIQDWAADHSAIVHWLRGDGPHTPNQVAQQQADAVQSEIDTIAQVAPQGIALTGQEIKANLDRRLKAAGTDRKRRAAAIRQAEVELGHSFVDIYGGDEEAVRAEENTQNYVASVKKALQVTKSGLHEAIEAIGNATDLETFVGATVTDIGLYGPSRGRRRRLQESILQGRELLATTPADDTETREKILQQIRAAQDQLLKDADEELKRMLRDARTPAEQGAARQQYISQFRQEKIAGPQRQIKVIQDRMGRRTKEIADAERELNKAEQEAMAARLAPNQRPDGLNPNDQFGLQGVGKDSNADRIARATENEKRKREAYKKLKSAQSTDKKELEELRKSLGLSKQEFQDLLREQEKAQFQAELASIGSATDLAQSQTADPVAQARIGVQGALDEYRKLQQGYRDHNVTIDELRAGLAKLNRARQQEAQAELGRFQARQGLASSQFALTHRDPGAIADFALKQAQANALHVAALVAAGKVDPDLLIQANKDVLDAKKAKADQLREEAEALIHAQAAWELAGTNDPLEQARIRAREATRIMRESPADTAAGRLQQRADKRRADEDARQAAYEDRYSDIAFAHDMGRITDQVFAQRLRDLAAQVKNNKDLKRRYLVEARRLEQAAKGETLALNLANIRLPTTYEVRRMMQGGGGRSTVVNNTVAPKVEVFVANEGDVPKVVEALDLHLGTTGRAALRSSGVIR